MYKLQSAQFVIAKIYRDLRLTDSRYITDMVEWIGEAMQYINAWPQLERVVTILEITSHRAELPEGIAGYHQIARAYDAEGKDYAIMKYNSSTFPASLHTENSPNRHVQQSENRYIINYNYIETNFETGWVMLAYDRFPLDDDGFPEIPDQVSFNEAMKWYIALRMVEGGWKHPAGLSYTDVESRWLKYCGQAREHFKMPTVDQYQEFLDNWVRLVPDYMRHATGFDEFKQLQERDYVSAEGIVVRGVDQLDQYEPDASPSP